MCIFIDGIDEFQGRHKEQLDLAVFLAWLTSFDLVKVCYASRPHAVLRKKLGPSMLLRDGRME